MFKQRLEKVIEDIQSKNKDIQVFPSLLDTCEPGKTGFAPRSTGETGYLLLCPFKIATRERAVKFKDPSPVDYMGVSPFMMVVMESGSSLYVPGDIVFIMPSMYKQLDENFLIIQASVGYYMPDSIVQGKDSNITDLVKNSTFVKTQGDA